MGRTEIRRYPGTSLIKEEYTVNEKGERHGIAKEFYSNGNLEFVINYKNGIMHGFVKGYYENGKLRTEANYINGEEERDSVKMYDENGRRIDAYDRFI
jgi:antitoxin component YwqK of YwqJK toxin-antitoxin module